MTTSEQGPAIMRGPSFDPGAPDGAFYLQPAGLLSGSLAAHARRKGTAEWLAGGPLAFTGCTVIRRRGTERSETLFGLADLRHWAADAGLAAALEDRLRRLSRPRAAVAGLRVDRPIIMGIINVTPDSFSDGGDFAEAGAAIAQGVALLEAGADILDIGGESTRPGAAPVGVEAEIGRVVPVVRALAARGAVISIDTRRAAVMTAAVEAGARLINDITALTGDPESLAVAARSGVAVVLMHMQGDPQTMQQDPRYVDAPLDLYDHFVERIAACEAAGLASDRLVLDPGIGFGKTVEHNFQIMERLALFHDLGCPILLGVSRKSFIGRVSRGEEAKRRFPGSIAAGLAGLSQGVQILRVHDVAETFQARAVWERLATCGQTPDQPAPA
ncbi:dihydropteroate synthase [Rhodospirillaceae bacterium SYSU D60014]|uniref:dihydropteroate synthase n=1 Tax=Virgifigura deserti TaxID=2268457 RepID=UPI000E65FA17